MKIMTKQNNLKKSRMRMIKIRRRPNEYDKDDEEDDENNDDNADRQ